MFYINRSSLLPSIESFQSSIPLTSTPKRSTKPQPLSSTLTTETNSYQKTDLSISAITAIKKHQKKKRRSHHHRRRPRSHIELKYLLYSTRAMKQKEIKQSSHEMKIYIV